MSRLEIGSPTQRSGWAGRLLGWWQSPRLWMLFASLITRGAGFVSSFLIARLSGAAALGVYSATVNTASSVVSPFNQVMTNNATLMAGERGGGVAWNAAAAANLLFSAGVALLAVCAFFAVYGGALHQHVDVDLPVGWLLAAGAAVIVGQVVTAIATGLLNGIGVFVSAARVTATGAALMMLAAYPVVAAWRLPGAIGLLLVSSLLPAALMVVLVVLQARRARAEGGQPAAKGAWRELRERSVAGLPSIAATLINAAVSWTCTIYLVQRSHGSAGVGVLAVSLQWLTLMLMPATSWGGVALKSLLDARVAGRGELRRARWRLIRRNLGVTFVVGAVIAALSQPLAAAYGMPDSDLAILLCVNLLCALASGANNIHERLLLCMDRQWLWFLFSLVAYGVQLAFTWFFIGRGLAAVPLGTLAAGATLWALSTGFAQVALSGEDTRD